MDLQGDPDTRPGTWGDAGAVYNRITFSPPAGCRVRILRAMGDFLTCPRGIVPRGKFAGALWGLQTTAPDGSAYADLANTMLYVQNATSGEPARAPIDFTVKAGGLLQLDNVPVSKMAVWLNDRGLQLHVEASFVVVYRFEGDAVSPPTPTPSPPTQ